MNVTILLILILLAATGVAVCLYYLQQYLQPEPSAIQARLKQIKEQHIQEEDRILRRGTMNPLGKFIKKPSLSNTNWAVILRQYSFTHHLQKVLEQGGMTIPVDRFIFTFLIAPIAVGFLISLFFINILPVLLGIFVAGFYYVGARLKQQQRLNKFITQLPDALNLMTSALRAGHAFQSAMAIVVQELPDPVSTEFGHVVNDINLGIPVKEALSKLVNNLDGLPDIRMLVTAILVQREAGGNLAEILDKLSYTIRQRFKLKGQVSALTGQSRLTGYVIGCAPILLFVVLYFIMNDYLKILYETDTGRGLLFIAVILQIIGFVVMQKIVEIRV